VTIENLKLGSVAGLTRVLTSTGEETGDRKDEILDTASRLFADTGFRTSLQDIADACGIRPGSLYHHFDSKEDIVVELIQRYHAELDQLADRALAELKGSDPSLELIMALGTAIARTAERHSAAVQFTFYEPPAGSDDELVGLARRRPAAVVAAMHETLRTAQRAGLIRSGLDLALLAERMVQAILSVGTGLFQGDPIDRVAYVLGDIFLLGMAEHAPSNSNLDRSDAMQGVRHVIGTWEADNGSSDDRAALIRAAARAEFGRRGYEVTTVRQIAARAGVSTGAVYRVFGSKEEMLVSIATSFSEKVMRGWSAALTSQSTAVEKIDALIWLQANVMEQFLDEFKMQLAWMRQSPPETSIFGSAFQSAVRGLRSLLSDGVRNGDLRRLNASWDVTSRCILALTWMPENSAQKVDKRAALTLARDTLLRGAAKR
jgi:AcrR family transcriptional regulator